MEFPLPLAPVVLGIAVVALFIAARRATTVCLLDVRGGRVSVRRGQLAPRLVADLGDIAKRPKVGQATIRIRRDGGRAAVELSGDFSDAQAQQIRNVIGSVPLAKLGSGGRPR